jgi:hypothetical protein
MVERCSALGQNETMMSFPRVIAYGLSLIFAAGAAFAAEVDFRRDVRPILAKHCLKCHGPDEGQRQSGLRLDLRDTATAPAESGERAIVPGKPEASELVRRINSADEDEIMPPPATKNPLSAADKATLKAWIAAGAEFQPHWSFVRPKVAPLPLVKKIDWPRNSIDHFVLARIEAEGLTPSPRAEKHTLVRRVYLDLVGLPPTPEETAAFVQDESPDAYERLVGRLFASPRYGERWARRWLDLARYADTNGYEKDRVRSMWPYRDWVIGALNADLPFDQFTIEQLAGDMLPGATISQRVATGFHRNTMINEEGGIDPLEFRFHAMTDRVSTTATVWLGLTLGCAQCHTHKYDPFPHREYYGFMALLNNADEPEMEVPRDDLAAKRRELEAQIAAREADLANQFPAEGEIRWHVARPREAVSAARVTLKILEDDSLLASGGKPERDTYSVTLGGTKGKFSSLRLEALPDPSLGKNGPGRTPHGNFVLSEMSVELDGKPVKLARAEADFAQDGFPASHAIDGNGKTGWAIHGTDPWNVRRAATFTFEKPVEVTEVSTWKITLDQQHGMQHTLGRFRLSLGEPLDDARPLAERRKDHLAKKFAAWLAAESEKAVDWRVLRPTKAISNLPLLEIQADDSVFVSSDQSKRDLYELAYRNPLHGVTAIRLEALPDDRLPKRGPGRVYYEGPAGDFFLSEVTLVAGGKRIGLASASQSFASGNNTAAAAIDGDPQTGWSINGGQGKTHTAVFRLKEPLAEGGELALGLLFEKYYAAGLGKFRVSVTTDSRPVAASAVPAEIERLLLVPAGERTAVQMEKLLAHFLSQAPELASAREEIQKLRSQLPAYATTLVMIERPANNPRPTHRHHRGEFLQPKERVTPNVPGVLPPLPEDAPRDRLAFVRWLVSPENPLVGRVTVNRHWAAFFGRGLVRTTEDFGLQGELPTHPELLDWLAQEMVRQGWSIKRLHRLIVTSATYQQSSRATPELLERDPRNILLSRGPRHRLEAELIRDSALAAAGLLSGKIGGPSVFPPQPPGVSSEGAYGPLQWNVSAGEDRYRRGLYTFTKRTAPYAMFGTFDAPSGEACVPRRDTSNTPLQALTLLNDAVFVEASQELGRQLAAERGSVDSKLASLWGRLLGRSAEAEELALLSRYFAAQLERLKLKELDAAKIAGPGPGDPAERAAWTLAARAVLNLDEMITKD